MKLLIGTLLLCTTAACLAACGSGKGDAEDVTLLQIGTVNCGKSEFKGEVADGQSFALDAIERALYTSGEGVTLPEGKLPHKMMGLRLDGTGARVLHYFLS